MTKTKVEKAEKIEVKVKKQRGRPKTIVAPEVVHLRFTDSQYASLKNLVAMGVCSNLSELVRRFVDEGILQAEIRHGGIDRAVKKAKVPAAFKDIVACQEYVADVRISLGHNVSALGDRLNEVWKCLQDAQLCTQQYRLMNIKLADVFVQALVNLVPANSPVGKRLQILQFKITELVNSEALKEKQDITAVN